jgi:hypothetical protein
VSVSLAPYSAMIFFLVAASTGPLSSAVLRGAPGLIHPGTLVPRPF